MNEADLAEILRFLIAHGFPVVSVAKDDATGILYIGTKMPE